MPPPPTLWVPGYLTTLETPAKHWLTWWTRSEGNHLLLWIFLQDWVSSFNTNSVVLLTFCTYLTFSVLTYLWITLAFLSLFPGLTLSRWISISLSTHHFFVIALLLNLPFHLRTLHSFSFSLSLFLFLSQSDSSVWLCRQQMWDVRCESGRWVGLPSSLALVCSFCTAVLTAHCQLTINERKEWRTRAWSGQGREEERQRGEERRGEEAQEPATVSSWTQITSCSSYNLWILTFYNRQAANSKHHGEPINPDVSLVFISSELQELQVTAGLVEQKAILYGLLP